jgi:hypothetical protein
LVEYIETEHWRLAVALSVPRPFLNRIYHDMKL